jgi:hypothetical protein
MRRAEAMKEPLLVPADDLRDDESEGGGEEGDRAGDPWVRLAAHGRANSSPTGGGPHAAVPHGSEASRPPAIGPPHGRTASARGRSEAGAGCFSIFSEATRYTQQRISALSRAAGEGCRDAIMFPAIARWGSVTSLNLRAFDMSFSPEDPESSGPARYSVPRPASGVQSWVGARLWFALREAARGVRFPYKVASVLGLHHDDENYKSYYSRRHRQAARGGEGLVVCLPMRILEISASGRTRERIDLNQLDLLRECFRHMKRPNFQLAAILHPAKFANLESLKDSLQGDRHGGEGHPDHEGDAHGSARSRKDVFFSLTPDLSSGRLHAAGSDDASIGVSIAAEHLDLQQLRLGDFRALQPLGNAEVLVRDGAVVVGLDPVRAVLTSSRLYVVVPPGDDNVLQQLQDRLWKAGAFQGASSSRRERSDGDAAVRGAPAVAFGPGLGKCGSKFQEAALGAVFATVLDFYMEQVRLLAYTSVSVWNAVRWRVSSAEMNKLLLLRVRLEELLRQVEGVDLLMETLHVQVDLQSAHSCGGFSLGDTGRDARGAGGVPQDGVGVREVAWLLEEHMGEIGVLRTYLKNILEELEDMRVLLQFQLLCRYGCPLIPLQYVNGVSSCLVILTACLCGAAARTSC